MASLRILDLVVIALYFAGVAWIGFRFSRRQTSTETYFVAGRSIPHWAMGLSIFATIISSITFVAYPGAAYKENWNQLVPGFMAVGVLLVAGTILIAFFRHAVGMSAYEYFEKRFGYGARAYSALAFTAGHFSKMGFVLFTITTAICGMTGWDKYQVIVGVGFITVFFTLIGGLEAVIWTEVLQGIVKLAGVVVVIGVLLAIMPGGAGAAFHLAADKNKFSLGSFDFNLAQNGNFWVMLLYGSFWYLQKYAADQTLVQRYLVAKNDRDALKGAALGAALCVPAWTAFMLVGTLLWAYYQLSGEVLPAHLLDDNGNVLHDRVFPFFLTTKIPAGLAGIFMAALMSAAMSTMSSDLNCLSAVGVEDYYRKLRPASTDKERLLTGKFIVAVCGAVAIGIGAIIAWRGESRARVHCVGGVDEHAHTREETRSRPPRIQLHLAERDDRRHRTCHRAGRRLAGELLLSRAADGDAWHDHLGLVGKTKNFAGQRSPGSRRDGDQLLKAMNIQHPTSNIQHPTRRVCVGRFIGCSMLDVGCWMFPTHA